jgi:hypothetical protein
LKLSYGLGIEGNKNRNNGTIHLNQSINMADIKRFIMKNSKLVSTPLEIVLKLIKDQSLEFKKIDFMNIIPYKEVATSILFVI